MIIGSQIKLTRYEIEVLKLKAEQSGMSIEDFIKKIFLDLRCNSPIKK